MCVIKSIIIIITVVIALSPVVDGICATPVMCSGGSFMAGDKAFINCYFNKDVNATKHNFNIVQYPYRSDGSTSDSGTHVLLCNWGPFPNQLECKTEDGYKFHKAVSDRLRLDIPAATKDAEGMYVCQLVPDDGIPVHTCQLQVQDSNSDIDRAAALTASGCSCDNQLDQPVDVKQQSDADQGSAGLVAGIVVLVIVLIVIIAGFIVLIVLIRLKRLKLTDNGSCFKKPAHRDAHDEEHTVPCRCFCFTTNLPAFGRREAAAPPPKSSYDIVSNGTQKKTDQEADDDIDGLRPTSTSTPEKPAMQGSQSELETSLVRRCIQLNGILNGSFKSDCGECEENDN